MGYNNDLCEFCNEKLNKKEKIIELPGVSLKAKVCSNCNSLNFPQNVLPQLARLLNKEYRSKMNEEKRAELENKVIVLNIKKVREKYHRERLDISEIGNFTHQRVSELELNVSDMRITTVVRIAMAIGCDFTELIQVVDKDSLKEGDYPHVLELMN